MFTVSSAQREIGAQAVGRNAGGRGIFQGEPPPPPQHGLGGTSKPWALQLGFSTEDRTVGFLGNESWTWYMERMSPGEG